MNNILTEIISLLTGGISGIATGIGAGLQTLAKSIFIYETTVGEVTTQSLSVFGGLIAVFGGISLAISLSRAVVGWVKSLGAKRL